MTYIEDWVERLEARLQTHPFPFVLRILAAPLLLTLYTFIACYHAYMVLFRHERHSFEAFYGNNDNMQNVPMRDKHRLWKRRMQVSSAASLAVMVAMVAISTLFSTGLPVFAADATITCSGDAGSPTAVTESSYNDTYNLTFSGGGYCALDEALTALSVTISGSTTLTQVSQDVDGVTITAGSIDIQTGSSIDVEKRGCAGGSNSANGTGPDVNDSDTDGNALECIASMSGYGDGSYDSGAGGSYGGVGGRAYDSFTGAQYGSATAPLHLGSGGGGANAVNGGAGGGLVKLTVSGTLTVSGNIKANGGAGQAGSRAGGGGSGGTVYIIADTIAGSGAISANGGAGAGLAGVDGGGGGGGRIALYYDTNSSFTLSNVTATKGVAGGTDTNAADGAPGSTFLLNRETDDGAGTLTVTSGLDFTSSGDYARDNIAISANASLTCPSAITTLTVSATDDLTDNGSRWTCSSAITTLNLTAIDVLTTTGVTWSLTGVAAMNLSAATWTSSGTNAITLNKGGVLADWNVTNALTLNNLTYTGGAAGTSSASGGVITMDNAIDVALVNSDITSSVSWTGLASLNVDADSSIAATGLGCGGGSTSQGNGYGPNSSTGVCAISTTGYGIGNYDSGGSGGYGGNSGASEYEATLGATYGSNTAPTHFGSGGGGGSGIAGGAGGGIVRLDVLGTTTVAGAISSNGANGSKATRPSGAGSGGSVYITTGTLAGAGTVDANGGNGDTVSGIDSGGGGGGRVAIKYATNSSTFLAGMTAANSATGGTKGGAAAGDGSTGTLSTAQYSVASTPTISAPTEAATSQSRSITVTTSAYSSDGAAHTTTSWQISDNNTFSDSDCSDTNIVFCNMTSANKESVAVNSSNGTFQNALNGLTQLAPNTQYYVRARHTNAAGSSSWSTAVSFTTTANVAPSTPTNSTPANSATGVSKNPTLTASAYSNSDSDAHKYSDWSLYESDACAGTADWTKTGDQTNLTSIVVNTTNGTFADALDGRTTLKAHTTYSFRVRYTDIYDGTSSNSTCTLFTTTNTAPTLDSSVPDQSLTEDTNAPAAFDLDTYFSDVDFNDDDDYTCSATNGLSAALGIMTINSNRTIDFTLEANANGSDTIQFSCEDGGGSATASNAVTVTISAVNDTPAFTGTISTQTTNEDTNLSNAFDLDSFFSDVDSGDACTYSVVNDFSMGTMSISTGQVSFTLTANANGSDTVQFRCTDTSAATQDSNVVTMNVTAVNDAPTFDTNIGVIGMEEDVDRIAVVDLDDYFGDVDTGDTCTYTVVDDWDYGDITLNNNGTVDLSPTLDALGSDTVQFRCTDTGTATVNSNSVTINLTADNDAPSITGVGDIEIDEGTTLVIVAQGVDVDTNALSFTAQDTTGSFANKNYTVSELFTDNGNNTGTFTWKPGYTDAGDYGLGFTVSDGFTTASTNITISVNAANSVPTFEGSLPNVAITGNTAEMDVATTNAVFDLDEYFTDLDEETLTFTAVGNDKVTPFFEDGEVSFAAANGFAGSESIIFRGTDEAGESAISNTVVVTVSAALSLDTIDYITGKSKGAGKVTVVDEDGNKTSWIAYPIGGVVPRIAEINDKGFVFVTKNRPGTTMHVYTLSGELKKKRRLSPKVHWRDVATGDLKGSAASEEVVVATLRGTHIYFKIFSYNAKKNQIGLLYKAKTGVPGAGPIRDNIFTVNIQKQTIILRNSDGDTVATWKPFK